MDLLSGDISVLYIAGYSRSGTTLADILLGNLDDHFSAGEICFFPTNGLVDNEFCSCGNKVKECTFWNKVASDWDKKRSLSLEDYNRIYHSYLRNRRAIFFFYRLIFPNSIFKAFLTDTLALYQVISILNGGKKIVDSSKSPYRLLLLKKLGLRLEVVHMVRSIRGVLFSTSKTLPKNSPSGVEKDIKPRNAWHVMFTWVINNLFTIWFSIGLKKTTVEFYELLNEPFKAISSIQSISAEKAQLFREGGPFVTGHLVAGGRNRMQRFITIDKGLAKQENWIGTGIAERVVRLLDKIKWG